MVHKKGVGSSKNGSKLVSKRLGVKIFLATSSFDKKENNIIREIGLDKDQTLFALVDGFVRKETYQ